MDIKQLNEELAKILIEDKKVADEIRALSNFLGISTDDIKAHHKHFLTCRDGNGYIVSSNRKQLKSLATDMLWGCFADDDFPFDAIGGKDKYILPNGDIDWEKAYADLVNTNESYYITAMLAGVDGEEHEIELDGKTFYIYHDGEGEIF